MRQHYDHRKASSRSWSAQAGIIQMKADPSVMAADSLQQLILNLISTLPKLSDTLVYLRAPAPVCLHSSGRRRARR